MITGSGGSINKDGDGTDVVSVCFQMEVLQESRMMIPDCHRRLAIAHADLLQLLVSNARRVIAQHDETLHSAAVTVTNLSSG